MNQPPLRQIYRPFETAVADKPRVHGVAVLDRSWEAYLEQPETQEAFNRDFYRGLGLDASIDPRAF